MNEKTLRVLEYNKIKDMLRDQAVSTMAKEKIDKLMPISNSEEIINMQKETTEAASIIRRIGRIPLNRIFDIKAAIIRTRKGGTLDTRQFLDILYNLRTAKAVKSALKPDVVNNNEIIFGLSEAITTQRSLEDEISRCILAENEIADDASSELRSIRRQLKRKEDSISGKLNSIISSQSAKTMLQDALITMRNGRQVIPVKQEYRSKFPGIIHDSSSTGATLFIEPAAIVNINNELRELKNKELAEIEKILAALSVQVFEKSEEILINQEVLIKLDYIFAKGKLSNKMRASEPEIKASGHVRIRNGRHPLIPDNEVVPISIELGKTFDTLVITGPNTGGKTVTLKTVGLFMLMAQSGLHIPAEHGTEIIVFDKVFADIGDEQSIEQSLSTFSSHMTNIVDIVKHSDENTLVLVDELGAGTDPTEGAALAIAILDYLYGKGCKTIATTHYTELKKYALITDGIQNGSVEFNVETLSPTYRLTIGTVGRSNAFEISKKIGLEDYIINEARKLVGQEDTAFEEIISTIENDRREAEEEKDEAIKLKIEIKKLKHEIDSKKTKIEDQRERIISEAKEEARKLLKDAKAFSDNAAKEIRKIENITDSKERNRQLENLRTGVREKISSNIEKQTKKEPEPHQVPKNLKIGDNVKIVSLGQKGAVIALPDSNGDVMVQAGIMKIKININNLIRTSEAKVTDNISKSSVGKIYKSKAQNISPTVDVRGELLEDAVMDVEKYLDDAYIAGLKQVTVVHGKGGGILRKGIQESLKSNKYIKKFNNGGFDEGGDGVTIVQFH